MNTPRHSASRRILAGFCAAAIGLIAASTSARADDSGNIDVTRTGSITVHKFEQTSPAADTAGDGTAIDTSGLTPLEGVTFTASPVEGLDLASSASWDVVSGLAYSNGVVTDGNGVTYDLGGTSTQVTSAEGTARFSDLPIGVYLVQETDSGANPITTSTAPFFVTIPLPHDSGWLYDVHVYPKNSVTAIDKQVDDSSALGLGDIVTWPISVTIPAEGQGESLSKLVITDTLDDRLSYQSATVAGPVDLTADTDYISATEGQKVTVTFTTEGLAKLQAHAGEKLTVTLSTAVTSIGDGTIANQALVNVNDYDGTTNKPVTKWGAVRIDKFTTADDQRQSLSGASFQVFSSQEDATAGTNPISVSGVDTFTTGSDGAALIEGLNVGQSGSRDYWIVETAAPAGFILNSDPQKVTVTAGSTADAAVISVENTRQDVPQLPLTGANGRLLLTIAGVVLVLSAAGVSLIRRSRQA